MHIGIRHQLPERDKYVQALQLFLREIPECQWADKSSPVFADGFRVGIVRDLYYDYTQPGKVVAEIDVDPELRIPKGSTAELAAEMLGGVKMNLLLANNPRKKYQIGDTIPGVLNNGMMEKLPP